MPEVIAIKSFPHIGTVKTGQKIKCDAATAKELLRRGLVKPAPVAPKARSAKADPDAQTDKQ